MKEQVKQALNNYNNIKNRNNLKILFSLYNELTGESMEVSNCSTCINKVIKHLESIK